MKIPAKIELYLVKNALPGEAVFLDSALLDQLIWNYPDFNIYPGGGETIRSASSLNNFFILSFIDTKDFDFADDFEETIN